MKLTKCRFSLTTLLLFIVINSRITSATENIIELNNKKENITTNYKDKNKKEESDDNYDDDDYDDNYEEEVEKIKDPLESFNRKIFSFNIFMTERVATPMSNVYHKITNQFIRDRINNLGDRFFDPITLLNSILQLNFKNSAKTIATFTTNMTIGIFGLFNPAKHFGFYRDKQTFGQTLAFYGVNYGIYIMLPFLGPTTLRDGTGKLFDAAVDPFTFNVLRVGGDNGDITPSKLKIPEIISIYAGPVDNAVKLNKDFLKKSFDPYIFTRDSYMQNLKYRTKINKEVKNEN